MPPTVLKTGLVVAILLAGSVVRLSAQPLTATPLGAAPPKTGEDELIRRARQAATDFEKSLPNFVCQEVMSRFQSDTIRPAWVPVDVVTAELLYDDGKEDYRHVSVNGKSSTKRMEQLQGAWSTGEFGSILVQLFSPQTAADFRFREDSLVGAKRARVFKFDVARENSQWMIEAAGQATQPAYGGSVWIDAQSARVLRVEMQAHNLPPRFPADRVESSTDYEFVKIGSEKYLLPAHCETLTCDRAATRCARNVIYFVDYHRYTSESNVHFGTGKQ